MTFDYNGVALVTNTIAEMQNLKNYRDRLCINIVGFIHIKMIAFGRFYKITSDNVRNVSKKHFNNPYYSLGSEYK